MRFERIRPRPATVLSMLGHATFCALLAIEAPRHLAVVRSPAAIEVVMVAPPENRAAPFAPPTTATPTPPQAASQSTPPPINPARPSSAAPVTATEYFASSVLNDPRNRKTRQTLAALGSDERLIQLCNIEAIEQLKRWKAGFTPDHVVAYATADPSLTATSVKAPGAAVHAGGKWYGLSFGCTAAADLGRVASFDFTLGRPIPRQQWEQDNLPELVEGDATD